MKQYVTYLIILLLALVLVACGGEAESSTSPVVISAENGTTTQSSSNLRLNEDYANAASIQTQLAIGTLRLEETELAVDAALASEILPLWQALQALGQNEGTASAELTAVANQIQDSMSADQINFISDMQITNESIQELVSEGLITIGRGTGADGEGATERGGGQVPPGGGQGRGGPGGFAGGNIDEDALATRQAERTERGGANGGFVIDAVVRLLTNKAGEAN